MKVTYPVEFDVDLSAKERTSLEHLFGECEVGKVAKLTVQVTVIIAEKLPSKTKP